MAQDTTAGPGLETRRMQGALERSLFGHDSAPVRVGRFAILELVGQGGMGTVYLAYDPRLDRRVAVKLLRGRDRGDTARLTEEALALARLNHPNVVTIHEVGDHDGGIFVAMEYVDGGTLEPWCTPDTASRDRWRSVLALAEQAIAGLGAAHAVGIVHRDLKPANMLIGSDGRLRLGDFGLAVEAPDPHGTADPRVPTAVGTPAYMAPEQFEGRADARSDQFSLCASFFHAFYGRRAFTGTAASSGPQHDPATVIAAVPGRGHVPRHLEAALLRGLAFDPAARFADVSELREALRPPAGRRWWWLGPTALLGVVAVATMGTSATDPPCALPREPPGDGWSATRRAAITEGIRATGLPHAESTLTRIDDQVSRTVTRWQRQRDAACEAERSTDPERSHAGARLGECLRDAARTLDAITAHLVRPDADDVTRAGDVLVLMEDLTDCERGPDAPEYDDARASALLQAVHDGRIAAEFGDGDAARVAFERVLADGTAGELPRLRSIAHQQLARLADDRDDSAAVRRHERGWLDEAELAGDPELAATGWAALAVDHDTSLDLAEFYLDRARVYERRGALDAITRAEIDRRAAMVHITHGDHAGAIALAQRAVAALPPDDGVRLPYVLSTLSDALIRTDDFAGAIAARREALRLLEIRLGPEHPDVAISRKQLAEAHGLAQDEASALALLDEAIATLEANPGFRPIQRATALVSRGVARSNLGQTEGAIEDLERAEDLLSTLLEPDDPLRVLPLDPLARALIGVDRRGQALDVVDRALSLALETDPVALHDLNLLRAELLVTFERIDDAGEALERAVALRSRAFAPGSVSALQAIEETAKVLISIRRPETAERELVTVLAPTVATPPEWTARLRLQYARALAAQGQHWAARAQADLVREAIADAEALPSTRADLEALLATLDAAR